MKLVEQHDGDTFRCVYVAKLDRAVFVLHAFKKKSNSGIRTPQREIEVVSRRFKLAQAEHARMIALADSEQDANK